MCPGVMLSTGRARESPNPIEFGNAGQNWENIGWKVKVDFTELAQRILPKDHIQILRPLLPYSPLQPNGNGLQSVLFDRNSYGPSRGINWPDWRGGRAAGTCCKSHQTPSVSN
jgi:hypothetical protein